MPLSEVAQEGPKRTSGGTNGLQRANIASGKLLGNFWETSGKLLGPSRPAFRSSNNKVNQLKIDNMNPLKTLRGDS